MLVKIIFFSLVALVFLGLGISGITHAALNGYHKVDSNPVIHELQQKAVNAAKAEASKLVNQATNATISAIDQKIGAAP